MPDVKMLRAIFGYAKQAGVDNEGLHDIIAVRFEKTSLKELTDSEVKALIAGLRGKPWEHGGGVSGYRHTDRGDAMAKAGRRKDAGGPDYFVGDRDMRLLRDTAYLRGWSDETLESFIARQLRGKPLRLMSQFNKVLWALKSMNRRDRIHG
jgi:hypothetical protein